MRSFQVPWLYATSRFTDHEIKKSISFASLTSRSVGKVIRGRHIVLIMSQMRSFRYVLHAQNKSSVIITSEVCIMLIRFGWRFLRVTQPSDNRYHWGLVDDVTSSNKDLWRTKSIHQELYAEIAGARLCWVFLSTVVCSDFVCGSGDDCSLYELNVAGNPRMKPRRP